MTVKIRLMSADPDQLAAVDAAVRTVLDVPAPSDEYRSRRRTPPGAPPDPTRRRYLETTGPRPAHRPAQAEAISDPAPPPLAVADDAKRRRDLVGEIEALTAADRELTAQPWYPIRPGDVVLTHLPASDEIPAYGETYLAVDTDEIDLAGNAMLREVSRTRMPWDDEPTEPEHAKYLLHFDPRRCWRLFSIRSDGYLAPWCQADQLDDPAQLAAAQEWATAEIRKVSDEDTVTAWQEHPLGHIPVIGEEDQDDAAAPCEQLTPFYELWFEAGPSALVVIRAGAIVHGNPARAAAPVQTAGGTRA